MSCNDAVNLDGIINILRRWERHRGYLKKTMGNFKNGSPMYIQLSARHTQICRCIEELRRAIKE